MRASEAIPWSQIGTKAEADYQGDGLVVTPDDDGARLRCVFQRLEGEATREGLWLTSTVTNVVKDRFRVVAATVGRAAAEEARKSAFDSALPHTGLVELAGNVVRFIRPGLTEEYTVSIDGVRQDFLVRERPVGAGELVVRLAVSGAKVEPAAIGVRLVLENSGREIAYSRLRVTDGTGKELSARMEVMEAGARRLPRLNVAEAACAGLSLDTVEQATPERPEGHALLLAMLVQDADAVYPVRIDPTFSDANWMSINPSIPGADTPVHAAVVDGSGNLYIGGSFAVVGNTKANRIAKWDGNNWSALGSGMNNIVYALAISGSNVYAGGYFTNAGGIAANLIAKWNGSSWSALGSGMNGFVVYALTASGSNLYAGGVFTNAGGSAAANIAKWDGSSWSALGSGMSGGGFDRVNALAISGSNLYAGGRFTNAGGSAAASIAKWDGSSWTALGPGIANTVYALAVSGSDVYVGGDFTMAGGSEANRIAKWNGSSWAGLGSGVGDFLTSVTALAVSGSDLYAGGDFTTAGGNAANLIAKWNGSNWTALGAGINKYEYGMNYGVRALAASSSNVYAGGYFATASGIAAKHIAKWNGSNWTALGSPGMNNSVYALVASGRNVYAGGDFTTANGSAAKFTARWNAGNWSPLGSGMGGDGYFVHVDALAVSGSNVYAGGMFTNAGGSAAYYIAKWNGSSWSALGSGMGLATYTYYDYALLRVGALAVFGSDIYAGGYFTTAGGGLANHIAKWNGSYWTELGLTLPGGGTTGGGMNGGVWALAVSGSSVYAGGTFSTADGKPAKSIAKWDGTNWTTLGSGINGFLRALAVSGSSVYVGGQFTTAGGNLATNIAKWNGSSWTAMGSGMNNVVNALAVAGNNVYAGGDFTTADGSAANYIAKWNGSSWTPLGLGMNRRVTALAVSGNDLYVGGDFTTAGGKVSAYVARAYLPALPELSIVRSGSDATVSWPSADTAGFVLEQGGPVSAPASWITNTAGVADDGTNMSVTIPATNSLQLFRLRRP